MTKGRLAFVTGALGVVLVLVATSGRSSRAPGGETAGDPPASRPVAAAKVARADLARSISLSAELLPFQEVDVHAKVAGYVRSIRVDVGDHVRKGETIAELEIPEASHDLEKATAASRAAEQERKRAQAHYDEVHVGSQRLIEVAKQRPNLVAQQDIDTARAQDQGAQAALESAREHLEGSQAEEKRMRTMLDYGVIAAPFDGVITKRFADTGALIQAGTASNTQAMPVVSLAEDRLLRLAFPVPESAVPYIRIGTPVAIDVAAVHRQFGSTIARYAGQVDRSTRTMVTEVDVPNKDGTLTPGMYATVTVVLEERKGALSLPVLALAGNSVFRFGPGGVLEQRTVKLGLETAQRVELLDGLREGDLVVVGGRAELRPGDRATPKLVAEPGAQP
jgi:RND family efflux transporter MFP subunit